MHILSNRPHPLGGTLEDAVAYTLATAKDQIEVAGYEVRRGTEVRVLMPAYDPIGFFPRVGAEVTCPGLGLESHWTIVRIAYGYTQGGGQYGLQIRP